MQTATVYLNTRTKHINLSRMIFPTAFPSGPERSHTGRKEHTRTKAKAPSDRNPSPGHRTGGLGLRSGLGA